MTNTTIEEIIDELTKYVGPPDSENGKSSFINKEWTEDKQKEFCDWLFKRAYNDKKFRQGFMRWPLKDKQLIKQTIDWFTLSLPKTKYE